MATVSADDARQLTRTFLDASHALSVYRSEHYERLTDEERKKIKETAATLADYASEFIDLAVGITLDNMQASLDDLKGATAQAKEAISTIQKVKEVINIATALVGLAAAIAAKDPKSIVDSLGTLKGLLTAPPEKKAEN